MSIVEKALSRLQAAAQSQAPRTAVARTAPAEPAVAPAPERAPDRSTAEPRRAHKAADRVTIDFHRLRAANMLPPAAETHRAADELRRVKWPLFTEIFTQSPAGATNHNLLQVTSSVPGEGKTYTSINLALNAAREGDCDILLLDADMLKPRLTELLGLASRPGLTDMLADSTLTLDRTLLATDVDGLFVVPAGRDKSRGGEFAGMNRLDDVLWAMGTEFRGGVVVVDSPPLLAASLAQNISRTVGHVLMVVRALATPRAVVQEAVSLIDRPSAVSCILNQAPAFVGSSYGGYYGYGANTGGATDARR